MVHEKFHYASLEEVKQKTAELGVSIPFSDHLALLREPVTIDGHVFANRLAIQPMEGCDGKANGAPDELTIRRYGRFAKSGAALLWFEAVSYTHLVEYLPVSSTMVREAVKKGESVNTLVPVPVAEYIRQNHLYEER